MPGAGDYFAFPHTDFALAIPHAERAGNIGAGNGNVADTGVPAQRVGVSKSAWGVLPAAIISRSEMATTTRDHAILLWAAARPKNSLSQSGPSSHSSSDSAATDERGDSSVDSIDDVFAALAVGV